MPHATIRGIKLFWEEAGEGLPVVLLHPFPLNQSIWSAQRKELGAGYRIITPDLRGFGKSEPNGNLSSMDMFATDVRALLDELGLDQVVLGGLSMGGYVALAFYRLYPDRVRGLILADTRPQADDNQGRQSREELATLAEQSGAKGVGDLLLPKLLGESTFRLNPHIPMLIYGKIESAPPQSIAAASRGMAMRSDSTPLLPQISCPVLLLVGEQDTLTPPAVAQEMAEAIPNSTLHIIPDAGHLSSIEQPTAFTQALNEYLASLPA